LADAIVRLADDPALRASLGKSGRRFAADRFNRDRLAHEMLDVLEDTSHAAS
jgi:glycosyltransferase involved in cell wall biosynthesis